MFYDGIAGLTDEELDKLKKKAKTLGFKVKDRRKWWNRIGRKKPPGLTGIYWNVKTQRGEINEERFG